MRILGIDPASVTGWCILDGGTLIDYGIIKVDSSFDLGQRLNFIAIEIYRLITKYNPNEVCCEDLILSISGPKILGLLGRISGVIIRECYRYLNKNTILVSPPVWKKECGLNLKGNAIKLEVQLGVVKHFKLLDNEKIISIENNMGISELQLKEMKKEKRPKKEIVAFKKETEKLFKTYQKEIHSLTGIGEDISDSICIGLYLFEKLKKSDLIN